MDEKVIYSCVDQEHNTWNCRGCGYIETFEADGPMENGWNFCPGCGHEIEVEAVSPCPFDNGNCKIMGTTFSYIRFNPVKNLPPP